MQATTDAWNCNYPSHLSCFVFRYTFPLYITHEIYELLVCDDMWTCLGHYYLLAHGRHVHSDWGCDSECITTG
jgi:hypothetical protein